MTRLPQQLCLAVLNDEIKTRNRYNNDNKKFQTKKTMTMNIRLKFCMIAVNVKLRKTYFTSNTLGKKTLLTSNYVINVIIIYKLFF